MRIALDTNRYRDFADGSAAVVGQLEVADEVLLPFIVVAELRAGFAVGARGRENERALVAFMDAPGVAMLLADAETTRSYAELYRQLRAQGAPIPTNDLWIAALVVQHGLTLYSRDRHFGALPQIARLE